MQEHTTDEAILPQRPTCLTTRFMVPGWWERAYEVSVGASTRSLDPIVRSLQAGISPALHVHDAEALAVLLATLQEQLLSGQELLLEPMLHRKHAPTTAKGRVEAFERILQGIASLRFMRPAGGGRIKAISLFEQEEWHCQDDGAISVRLTPRDGASEVILGYADPYRDLVRRISGEDDVQSILGNRAPLALWQSTWLDLSGIEQALLLRLERAMQWEFRWLTLDGVFGMPLKQLFQDLELPRPRKPGSGITVMEIRRRLLEKLGKKLVDHGMLCGEMEDAYLALSAEETKGGWLVWQVAKDRIVPSEAAEYLHLCGRYLLDKVYAPEFAKIISVLSGHLGDEALTRQLRRGFDTIRIMALEENDCIVRLNDSMPLMGVPLFLEWTVRQLPGHACPLPDDLKQSAAAQLAMPQRTDDFSDRFQSFMAFMQDKQYADALTQVAGASLASPKTWEEKAYRRFLQTSRRTLESGAKANSGNAVTEAPKPTRKSSKVESGSSELSLGNLKKVAAEELQRMRKGDSARYEDLKKAYFEHLDPASRKMFLEVKQRSQPQVFEDQIRHSLIRFMVENPGSWRSAGASLDVTI